MARADPRVTIIVPTYNWSAVLPFSIGSALDQTFADFELIVVGDGCTDDSAEVVRALADERVQWVNLPANSGHQSAPNNEGLRRARGELVAYLGHDDLWLPHHLACLVAAIDAGADMAFGIALMVPPSPEPQVLTVADGFSSGVWIPPTATIHRRALTERLGGWQDYRDIRADPEAELWDRFCASGARIEAVKRLTAIKFPAALRRDVYRERPSHEQASWLARIREEKDFEAVTLGRVIAGTTGAGRELRFPALIGQVLRRSVTGAGRRLRRFGRPGNQIDRRRVFKGLAPAIGASGDEQ